MPDPDLKTVSATELPALWNRSPYGSRWTIYQRFANGKDLGGADSRMNWGRKMQPLVLDQAREDLALEVMPNDHDAYMRNGPVGCTRDAEIIDPSRGPGALETKCVFDYRTWMETWNGGEKLPAHVELQLQQQMIVGDGSASYGWGVIAVFVCGDMHYFHREPISGMAEAMNAAAEQFLTDVKNRNEPDPFGHPAEIPLLSQLERTKGKEIDLDDEGLARTVAAYSRDAGEVGALNKIQKARKARIMAALKDAEMLYLPHGVHVEAKDVERGAYEVNASRYVSIKPYVPEDYEPEDETDERAEADADEAVRTFGA